ncbi:LPS-assembly protein LptD [Spongorhabdus nitratireducens]
MPQNKIPFARKIPLVVTTGLLATPLSPLFAAEVTDAASWQWKCSAENGQWSCSKAPRKAGPLPAAPLPKEPPQAPSRSQQATTPAAAVVVEGETLVAPQPVSAAPIAVVSAPKVHEAIRTLDWTTNLTPEQQAKDPYCRGTYVEPDRPGKNFKGKPGDAPIHAEADNTTYSGDGPDKGVAQLHGNVVVRQGYRQLESDSTIIDRDTQITTMNGNVVIREPGMLMTGSAGEIYMDSGRAQLDDAQIVLHESHARLSADNIERGEDEVIDLEKAQFTTCPPGNNAWTIGGSEVSLDPTSGFGSAKHAVVRAGGYPVFYFPYLYFPIDDRRHTGFLYPTFGSSSKRGTYLKTPFYWNIAPNYDATITPHYMSKRGALLELEGRYLTENMSGELGGAYLNKDQLKKENINYDEDRWLLNWRHKQSFTERWKAEVDFANASDKEYLSDFGTSLKTSAQDVLNQNVSTTYMGGEGWNQWQAKVAIDKHKSMKNNADDPYDKEPQFEFQGKLFTDAGINIDYLLDHSSFTRDKNWQFHGFETDQEKSAYDKQNDIKRSKFGSGSGINNAVGDRRYFETAVSYPMVETWGYLKPKLKIRHVSYSLDRLKRKDFTNPNGLKYDTSPDTTAPTASIDAGLFMDRQVSLFDNSFTHTLEPRAMYVFTPKRDGQEQNPVFDSFEPDFSYAALWREDRFAGYDRFGDTNHLALGMTTRLIEDDGFERGHFGFGQIYYFSNREAFIDPVLANQGKQDTSYSPTEAQQRLLDQNKNGSSPFATELVWNFTRTLSLRQDWVYDFEESRNSEYALTASWLPERNKAINVGYRYRNLIDRYVKDKDGNIEYINGKPKTADGDLEQTDISVLWPLAYNWSSVARWQYDLTNSRHIERLVGVEYNSCCYQVRVGWRTWIDPAEDIDNADQDKGIFLQIVLRGLGSVMDRKVETWLQDIKGYTKREN